MIWYTLIATVWFETVAQMKGFWGEYKMIKVQEIITGRKTIKDRMTPAMFMPRCSFLLSWTDCLDTSVWGSIGRKKMVKNNKYRYSTCIWIDPALE